MINNNQEMKGEVLLDRDESVDFFKKNLKLHHKTLEISNLYSIYTHWCIEWGNGIAFFDDFVEKVGMEVNSGIKVIY